MHSRQEHKESYLAGQMLQVDAWGKHQKQQHDGFSDGHRETGINNNTIQTRKQKITNTCTWYESAYHEQRSHTVPRNTAAAAWLLARDSIKECPDDGWDVRVDRVNTAQTGMSRKAKSQLQQSKHYLVTLNALVSQESLNQVC